MIKENFSEENNRKNKIIEIENRFKEIEEYAKNNRKIYSRR
ncbi:hypothetical protein HRbin34_00236 [bacterium HR34]|nr:hypothetical protein HRbin34_00236 [bacterium HR34]